MSQTSTEHAVVVIVACAALLVFSLSTLTVDDAVLLCLSPMAFLFKSLTVEVLRSRPKIFLVAKEADTSWFNVPGINLIPDEKTFLYFYEYGKYYKVNPTFITRVEVSTSVLKTLKAVNPLTGEDKKTAIAEFLKSGKCDNVGKLEPAGSQCFYFTKEKYAESRLRLEGDELKVDEFMFMTWVTTKKTTWDAATTDSTLLYDAAGKEYPAKDLREQKETSKDKWDDFMDWIKDIGERLTDWKVWVPIAIVLGLVLIAWLYRMFKK